MAAAANAITGAREHEFFCSFRARFARRPCMQQRSVSSSSAAAANPRGRRRRFFRVLATEESRLAWHGALLLFFVRRSLLDGQTNFQT
jgi:hypothetical protein